MDNNQKSVATFNKLANKYQDKYMDLSLYSGRFDVFIEQLNISQASQLLELGCGPGNITQLLLQRSPKLNILATDLAPNMVELAQVNLNTKESPRAEVKIMDCRDCKQLVQQFDGIMCGFCIPYLPQHQCLDLIKDMSTLLTAGGLLYISSIEHESKSTNVSTNPDGDQVFTYYHQYDALREKLLSCGFELVHVERQISALQQTAQENDLFITAKLSHD